MTTEIKMPRLSETMTDGKILSWNKKEGDQVNKGDVIAEVETDKANMEVEAVDSGVIIQILVATGQLAKVGQPIAILNGKPAVKQESFKQVPQLSQEEPINKEKPQEDDKLTIKASPLARKLAKDKNIDITKIKGTGPGGRVQERDVIKFLETGTTEQKQEISPKEPTAEVIEKPPEEKAGEKIIELSRMKKTIAARMAESKQNIPHFYVTVEVVADKLIDFKKNYQETQNIHITFNDLFVKVTAMALEKNPILNSEYKGDFIEIQENINIGIAFSLKDGLIVPVIHNCNKKSLKEISNTAVSIREKIKNNKLEPEDMAGGTFTISNMGMYGVKSFSAIINSPEAAGLAIGSIYKTPVFMNNRITVSNIVNLTISADHRIVNGVDAAIFLNAIKEIIENIDTFENI